ncbi:hypothetical protein GOBAR_AA18902 [Gossypium barbadense]|uniref:Alkyl transferase n=1 Tax=Gossypium barbadense TaxID=3634 RepID=A0A2P5XEK5_GOSBA|nr:hypothetical protein GOBAR_AA18902 [Gossypium barbadense]
MERIGERVIQIYGNLVSLLRKCIFCILSVGPIPNHIAFIMDGNRRFTKKCKLMKGAGHKVGFSALMSILKYCYEFNLKLLSEPVRLAAERAMLATDKNSKAVLSICVAYTSTNEIMHAVQESCEEKWDEITILNSSGAGYGLISLGGYEQDEMDHLIKLNDIEKHMYMAASPDPDIIIRTSSETRLSNFLLWQSANCYLYSPSVLWPEIGFRQFLWAILNFQRIHFYLDKQRQQS